MRCPRCETLVRDGADVCPACHAQLHRDAPGTDADERWCASCGSPIPAGLDACPQCGMPVEGAFDDEDEAGGPDTAGEGESSPTDDTGYLSAIPAAPRDGNEALGGEVRRSFVRTVVLAACAATLLVGGTALFITRPWDPNAYATHAMEDADTSMEGFPGTVSHLTSQDFVRDAERQEYVARARKVLLRFHAYLRAVADEADGLAQVSETGSVVRARELRQAFMLRTSALRGLDLAGTDLVGRRDQLLLMAGYLQGALDVLSGSGSERTYAEWSALFENAYATL